MNGATAQTARVSMTVLPEHIGHFKGYLAITVARFCTLLIIICGQQ
jgi:hypothetical protein